MEYEGKKWAAKHKQLYRQGKSQISFEGFPELEDQKGKPMPYMLSHG